MQNFLIFNRKFTTMNRINKLFGIKYPVIQAGMIWCSGWELASAVSNAGGLGLIGSGSMEPEILRTHIQKCKKATAQPFGVNIPLLYAHAEEFIRIIIDEKVPVVFTSAGSPKIWTPVLKEHGIKIVHVVGNVKNAVKCEEAGVDAIVAEGFEAGGHNGKEETTTMVLIPLVRDAVSIPLIAAGGIATGRGMLAAFALGAEGVQIGTRFVAAAESSAHINFKNAVVNSSEGSTDLTLKHMVPVRLLKNKFYHDLSEAQTRNASREELLDILGKGRPKLGMFEGDMNEGELEIGQSVALTYMIKPAAEIISEMISEFNEILKKINRIY